MVDVPTREEFNALAARVSDLEKETNPPEGLQAKRVCDALGLFGVNTFSSLIPDQNLWGSYPADYTPASVAAALDYLTGGTGHSFCVREYHYQDRAEMQKEWIERLQFTQPIPLKITMCVGANGSPVDADSMIGMSAVWFEGLNEPNTDFGSGQVPFNTTVAIQQTVWQDGTSGVVMGPSIVAGMPHPEGWIEQYCGTPENLTFLNSLMSIGNGHLYPPDHPDAVGVSVSEYIGGLWSVYANHPIALTEYHPTLFNSYGFAPGQSGWSGDRDAYYLLCGLFRAIKCTVEGLWWYALFDYGSTYLCGLFPQGHADSPRPAATALRNLCRICADTGADGTGPRLHGPSVDGPTRTSPC